MTQPQDAALLAALYAQYAQLDELLARLESCRAAYLPTPATFWRGAARHAYDVALSGVVMTSDAACSTLREARDQLDWALREVRARG